MLLTKVILDSLAARYVAVIRTMETLTGRSVPGIHIVGGGSKNAYLNQATANAAGLPVVAGPSEATAAGNIMVQAIAAGEVRVPLGRARAAGPDSRTEDVLRSLDDGRSTMDDGRSE